MVVIILDDENKAYQASRALNDLDSEGSITVHGESVVKKNTDGTLSPKKVDGEFPIRTISGTAIGSLIGLLGGLPGAALGAIAGTMAGGATDIFAAGVDDDFLKDVSQKLTPGKYAVVADVSEEWETPLDTKIEALGAVVNRTTKKNFEAEMRARDIGSLRAEIDHVKAEQAKARAGNKAKLKAKIDSLTAKLQAKQAESKKRAQQLKRESDAKIQALSQKEAKARGDARSTLQARKTEIKNSYDDAAARLKAAEARHWEKRAETLRDEAAMFDERAKKIQAKSEES